MRHYSEAEYSKVEGDHLPIARLCAIWRGLPEQERLGFVHSLESTLADRVIELTAPATAPAKESTR